MITELLEQYREAVRRTYDTIKNIDAPHSEYKARLAVEVNIERQIADAFSAEYERATKTAIRNARTTRKSNHIRTGTNWGNYES